MQFLDWAVVGIYCIGMICMGIILSKKTKGVESYFVSGRELPWWLAGTSMIATAFASDTPLFVSGLVRSTGIWGNWIWWGLVFSTMLVAFVFARMWRRSQVVTEVEMTELRYSGTGASVLRGFKALLWGGLFNLYVAGAWPMTGLVKIMQTTVQWTKVEAIFFAASVTVVYCTVSGFWGVVATDFVQFLIAFLGAVILAIYAIDHAGGLGAIAANATVQDRAQFMPALPHDDFWASPFAMFLSFVIIQWWAGKNSTGSGIEVQRMLACKNEKHSVLATLWYAVGHHVLRVWPWILVGLASLAITNPEIQKKLAEMMGGDNERVYPAMVMLFLPAGIKGLVMASFFAAFMSTMDTHMNWGSSYMVNDLYKRFVVKGEVRQKTHRVAIYVSAAVTYALGAVVVWVSDMHLKYDTAGLAIVAAGVLVISALRIFKDMSPMAEISGAVGIVISLCLLPSFDSVLANAFSAGAIPLVRSILVVVCGLAAAGMVGRRPSELTTGGHHLFVSRAVSVLIVLGAMIVAFKSESIAGSFDFIMKLTSGIGTVMLARFLWWRTNAWSEIAAMGVSLGLATMTANPKTFGLPDNRLFALLFISLGTTVAWVAVTFATPPVDRKKLMEFYRRVRPPRWGWGPIAAECPEVNSGVWRGSLVFWWLAAGFVVLLNCGIGYLLTGNTVMGAVSILVSLTMGAIVVLGLEKWLPRESNP